MLEAADLGDLRIARELNKMLSAKVTKYYQDKSLGDHTDNAVRMRALELLADLNGKRKTDINLHTDIIEIVPPPKPEGPVADET